MIIIGFEVAGNVNYLNETPFCIMGNETLIWTFMIFAFQLKFSLLRLSWTLLLDYSIKDDR
jgi:hypothetical protein